ncbi:MAG: NYN domain-containing protein [Solobacterium sp.]|nr:NYN domain-containing protein [Solobacterium sp.]
MGKVQNNSRQIYDHLKVAILVDGAFYRKRAYTVYGDKSPQERAEELDHYCRKHLTENINGVSHEHDLYRIFYYDCEPSKKSVFNPLTKKNEELKETNMYSWTNEFLKELKKKRKFAVRLGEIADSGIGYYIPVPKTKELLLGKCKIEDLKSSDLSMMVTQKGVDMRIGLDIASMAFKKQVSQIVLISGDSDFVPAAKLARREGIDFVLDPLGAGIKENLEEHIDGLRTQDKRFINLQR